MTIRNIYQLPIAIFVTLLLTLILTYIVAVALGHVTPFFPYISDTGTFPPESCVFGQFLNIAAVLFALFGVIRYFQIKKYCLASADSPVKQQWNKLSFIFCLGSSLGLSMVGNFQETNVLVIHFIGAGLTFGGAGLYFITQVYISYRMPPEVASRRILHFRLAITLNAILISVIAASCGLISIILFHGKDVTKWKPEDGGFVLHVISAIGEWLVTLVYGTFLLTFVPEFRKLNVEPIKVWSDTSGESNMSGKYEPLLATEVDAVDEVEVLVEDEKSKTSVISDIS